MCVCVHVYLMFSSVDTQKSCAQECAGSRTQRNSARTLQWRHNGHGGVSNLQPHDCFFYWTVYSGTDQRKHQSSPSLAFVWEIHRWPMNSPQKWPVTRKMFPLDDVIKNLAWFGRGSNPRRLTQWQSPCIHFGSATLLPAPPILGQKSIPNWTHSMGWRPPEY